MRVHPLNGQVLLRPVEGATQTSGGIYLPDTARETPAEGVIEALPPGQHDELALGDRVLFKQHSGEEIVVDGSKYRLVPSGDLLAKYVEADAIPV